MTLEGRRPGEDSRASPSRRGPGSGCTGECAEADDPSTDSEHRRRKGHCFRRATECVRRKHEAHIPYPGYRASGSVARLDRLALRPGSGP